MKTIYLFSIFSFVWLYFFQSNLYSQVIEAEKSHALSKDARKGYLGSFKYDENSKQYTLVFVRERNKETIYETMKFDYDFNLLDTKSETLKLKEAAQKYDFVDYDEEPWSNPKVVRVDANAWGAGNVVLRKGYITREWEKPQSFTPGNYTVSYSGYWKFVFNETEKITPKIEVAVEIDPRAPKFVRNMAENQAKKIFLSAYMTDEPTVDYQLGRVYYNPRKATSAYWRPKTAFAKASGDIVVLGKQYYALDKTYFNRWVALKYSAQDLSEKARNFIPFDYGVDIFYKQILPDNTMVVFYAPLPGVYVKPAKPHENSRAFTYVRIDKDANIKERIEFESPSSKWEISDIQLTEKGEIYVYGQAIQKNNDKYYMDQINSKKFDNFQLMKISDGKIQYLTSTPLSEFAAKLQLPANMKKVDAYDGRKFEVGELTISSSGDIIITGQDNDNGKYGDISLFHFGTDGKLKAQYAYKLMETGKEAQSMPTIHVEFENTDNRTLSWIVYELTGATDDKILIYPRLAIIDLQNAKISDIQQYGYGKDKDFFVDNSRPVITVDNGDKVVFFGSDKKDKEIWFCRVKLVK